MCEEQNYRQKVNELLPKITQVTGEGRGGEVREHAISDLILCRETKEHRPSRRGVAKR